MHNKKVIATVSSLMIGTTAVFSNVPFTVQAEGNLNVVRQEEKIALEATSEEKESTENEVQQEVESVAIDEEHFPDEVFREYVRSNFDKDNDGVLSEEEIFEIKIIDIEYQKISSIQGVEYFIYLEDYFAIVRKLRN